VNRAIAEAINAGEIVAVGVLHLVRNTLVTALAGVQDVGAELGTAGVAAVRGSIKAAYGIGADVGTVAREAIRGTVTAAEAIGGDVGGAARSPRAARSRPPGTWAVTWRRSRAARWRAAWRRRASSAWTSARWPATRRAARWRRRIASAARPAAPCARRCRAAWPACAR
jgi:hypothetical protein